MENVNREIDYDYKISQAISTLNQVIDKLNAMTSKKIITKRSKKLSPDYIINGVCEFWGIDKSYLQIGKRDRELVERRKLTARLLHVYTNRTSDQIAKLLGYKNHATVLHHLKRVEEALSNEFYGNIEIKKTYSQLIDQLKLN